MEHQLVAEYITEIIVGASTLVIAAFKYREVIQFFWPAIKLLGKPISGFVRWVRLPYVVSAQQSVQADKVQSIETKLDELMKFTKEKLSPNGGSSAVDSLKRIESRQMIDGQVQLASLQDTNVGFFRCDMSGRNLWANRSYARFLGCGAQELLGFGWKRFIKTAELERYNEVWQTAFADNCEFEDVVQFTDVHNQTVPLKISVNLLTGDKGELLGYFGQVVPL